ncbi:MAG: PspA/IM30 family protein [Myxococcales bacterium]|nr:PspA/IM30 family protein [Myxococcales bacterium]
MSRVIKSNLNALVDQAEDPAKLIDQTVLDMEAELKNARGELVSTLGTAKRLVAKAKEHEAAAVDWERKAVLALEQGDEDLAREALRRKATATAEARATTDHAAQAEGAAEQMKSALDTVEKRIADLKARKPALAAQVRQARAQGARLTGNAEGSSAFDDLDRMSDRIGRLEAEVEAAQVLDDPNRAALDARFRELEKNSGNVHVEDELEGLKRKLRGG